MAEKVKNVTIITPKGIASYPYINRADTKFKAEGDYKCKLIVNANDPKVQELVALLDAAADEFVEATITELKAKGGKGIAKAKAVKKFIPYEAEFDDEGNETDNIILNAKTTAQAKNKQGEVFHKTIKVYDSKGTFLKNPPSIYGGSTLKLSCTLIPFYNAATDTAGVTLRMEAVQVIELVSGGTGPCPFGEEEDGYTGDTGFGDEPAPNGYTENEDF